MKGWKDVLNNHAFRPMQKFEYTRGKSSTDTALIIDAMDLLHSKRVDGFCIVSSDSDYTGLAHRIREEGLYIMGIGKNHTPRAFVQACETFTFSEILVTSRKTSPLLKSTRVSLSKTNAIDIIEKPQASQVEKKEIDLDLVNRVFQMIVDVNNNRARISSLKEGLCKLDPTFDERSFGFTSFRKYCEALQPHYKLVVDSDNTTNFIVQG